MKTLIKKFFDNEILSYLFFGVATTIVSVGTRLFIYHVSRDERLATAIGNIAGILFAFATNYIGYGGKMNLLAYVTTIAFALSLIANALNALKLTTQWGFWLIYNFVQLTKAGIQGNFANIGKYIFYILNAIGALFVWNDEEVEQ